MNRIIISAILATAAAAASAQVMPWSLDSCIAYAREHNITVRQSRVQQLNSEIAVTSAKDAFLPQLQGGASQSWGFGRGLTSDNTYADRNTSSTSFNVGMSLPIFQGLRALRNLDYARAELATALEQTAATRDNVELRVAD